ncbi:MAG: peptide chain release factor N(5)-glutamine methyltransferase [Deltaproteobacteria bacterium]|nr:peptide chain release factor N(5)-glutamine methyltransferase [Deltaproteobacteria bacterium]MBW2393858.1 peptide chain release factor N(5)-glutamine methyltransferase [Deltaproteobacteria bacterium]
MSSATNTQDKVWSVLELLRWTTSYFEEKGVDTARLDAECLLADALGIERLRLYIEFEKPVTPDERDRYRGLVRRRADERMPVALLLGKKEFWSLPLEVTSDVLVPRPETETLVEAALQATTEGPLEILDLGTGSGAVALALAKERPEARITASDVSAAALDVARRNAEKLELGSSLEFCCGDAFEPVAGRHFDVIVSNPPYLAESEATELAPELSHEPKQALFAGPEGTELLRRIAEEAGSLLNPGGWLGVELAPHQAETMMGWLLEAGFEDVIVHRDLTDRARVVSGRRPRTGG